MQLKVIEHKKIYYIISSIVIGLGVLFMVINMARGQGAFSKDIQFTGGSLIQVDVKQSFSKDIKDEVQEIAEEVTGHSKISITSAGTTGVIITMPQTATDVRTKLFETLKEKYNLEDADLLADEDVSASISKDIKTGAVKAVAIGSILILIYISLRFKDYRFGASAVVALLHDVLIMLVTYAIFRIPLNNSFIAAILTIVGYSINDTVIIFDRIRENKVKRGFKLHDAATVELIDDSINQTVGRSISTSFTTIVMVVLLCILGTESVREFAFPLIVGIAAGAYSSIFIASPVLYDLTQRHAKKHENTNKVSKKKTSKKKV